MQQESQTSFLDTMIATDEDDAAGAAAVAQLIENMNEELVVDIETIPTLDAAVQARIAEQVTYPSNISKQDTIDAWNREKRPQAIIDAIAKTGLNGMYGHICTLVVARNNDDPVAFTMPEVSVMGERALLQQFHAWLFKTYVPGTRFPRIIGHFHIGFDLPFIFQRQVLHQLVPPSWWPRADVRPYNSERIFDTMQGFVGGRNTISMDNACAALGLPGKGDEIDGSRVWEFVKAGKLDRVEAYCIGDVRRTRSMYRRLHFKDPLPADLIGSGDDSIPM